jgi:hypothetical protein
LVSVERHSSGCGEVGMSLGERYLIERGISLDTAARYGLEIDTRVSSKMANERLGLGLPKSVIEIVWFPVRDANGKIIHWIARILPTIANLGKFLCPVGSGGIPFIPQNVYGLAYGKPIVITEGPTKTIACAQCGFDAIGLNGVWGAGIKNSQDFYVISAALQSALDWRGRYVYLGFDADCAINPQVRQALFRLFFLLSVSGAQVFQLTSWDPAKAKGIDDFLVTQSNPSEALKNLIAAAKPFIDTIEPTALDLGLVSLELQKVFIPDLLREQLAKPLAQRLGILIGDLRKIGVSVRKPADFIDPEPWPQPVIGHQLLAELSALIEKHVITGDHCKVAIALWIILSYLIDHVDILPLLAITSPEKRCGKSRLLTLLLKLVRRPIPGVSLSAATVYRAIEKWHPTLLVDEADGVLKDSRGHDNLELRSVINSGHTRELAFVNRCVGDNHDVQTFSTWAPKAIALIGRMPDSMMDRSIPIPMKRKTKADTVARIRETPKSVFEELQSKIVRFVNDNATAIRGLVPSLPSGLNDRAEDCWLPMLALADVAGGAWPDLARKAALALSADTDDSDTFITKLLRALKEDFEEQGETHANGFQLTTDICDHLNQDTEAPWANLKNQMTPELLAKNLSRYPVKSDRITLNNQKVRGFHWKKLKPVFDGYL